MENKKVRLFPGEARVQYAAIREDAKDLIENKFYTVAGAHRKLTQEGKISMSCSAFMKLYMTDKETNYFERDKQKQKVSQEGAPKQDNIQQKQSPQIYGDTSDIHKKFEPVKYAGTAIIKEEE